ncbi:MAG: flavodoxin family protein [Hyphomonas sp.]|nr:flavodoxin family protein [Hyphomonas sp.]
MTTLVSIVYHSGYGHTSVLARSVQAGVAATDGATPHLIDVTQMTDRCWEILDASDAIIFGSPTYMGAVSGPFKTFMDKTSGIWFKRGWQDKLAAGFTVSSSQAGDKFATLSQLATLAAQHGMLWVSLGLAPGNNASTASIDDINRIGGSLGVMAQANADQGGDVAPPAADRETARLLGQRVARLAVQFSQAAQLEAATV